jgi:hypothetical protein
MSTSSKPAAVGDEIERLARGLFLAVNPGWESEWDAKGHSRVPEIARTSFYNGARLVRRKVLEARMDECARWTAPNGSARLRELTAELAALEE